MLPSNAMRRIPPLPRIGSKTLTAKRKQNHCVKTLDKILAWPEFQAKTRMHLCYLEIHNGCHYPINEYDYRTQWMIW